MSAYFNMITNTFDGDRIDVCLDHRLRLHQQQYHMETVHLDLGFGQSCVNSYIIKEFAICSETLLFIKELIHTMSVYATGTGKSTSYA